MLLTPQRRFNVKKIAIALTGWVYDFLFIALDIRIIEESISENVILTGSRPPLRPWSIGFLKTSTYLVI